MTGDSSKKEPTHNCDLTYPPPPLITTLTLYNLFSITHRIIEVIALDLNR